MKTLFCDHLDFGVFLIRAIIILFLFLVVVSHLTFCRHVETTMSMWLQTSFSLACKLLLGLALVWCFFRVYTLAIILVATRSRLHGTLYLYL